MKALASCLFVVALGQPVLAQTEYTLPLVMAASNRVQQSLLRIINHSDRDGTVQIVAFDDSGERFGPVYLSLNAKEAVHFNATDLEEGNTFENLSGGIGDGEGNWHLKLYTELDIEPLAYIRTADGFVNSMYDVVAEYEPRHYYVPTFNPSRRSLPRLVNPAGSDTTVTITGQDDEGERALGPVLLNLLPRATCTLIALELEARIANGDCPIQMGSLGNGTRKWRLLVYASRPIQVMSLLRNLDGHLTNFSASTLKKNFYAEFADHRSCGNERNLAMNFSKTVREWDGTPFRVDMVRSFPDFVSDDDLWELLRPIARLADQIEQQLGYRIVEMGSVIDVPEGAASNWNTDYEYYWRNDSNNALLPRETGQILVFCMDDDNPRDWDGRGGSPHAAHGCCGTISYNKTDHGGVVVRSRSLLQVGRERSLRCGGY